MEVTAQPGKIKVTEFCAERIKDPHERGRQSFRMLPWTDWREDFTESRQIRSSLFC